MAPRLAESEASACRRRLLRCPPAELEPVAGAHRLAAGRRCGSLGWPSSGRPRLLRSLGLSAEVSTEGPPDRGLPVAGPESLARRTALPPAWPPTDEVLDRMFGMSPSRRNAVKVAENLSQAKISGLAVEVAPLRAWREVR